MIDFVLVVQVVQYSGSILRVPEHKLSTGG